LLCVVPFRRQLRHEKGNSVVRIPVDDIFPALVNPIFAHIRRHTPQLPVLCLMTNTLCFPSLIILLRREFVLRGACQCHANRAAFPGRKQFEVTVLIDSAKKLLASGIPAREVAANLGISIPTLYRWIPAS
jgi:hypothetical protein